MQALLTAYIEDPTVAHFLRLRQAIVDHPAYDPYSGDLDQLGELLERGDHAQAIAALPTVLPNLLISPRFHYFAAVANRELGRDDGHQIEMHLCLLCLRGIAETGDGSLDRPYRVTRISDEYDFVHFELQDDIAAQAVIQGDTAALDLLTLTGGRQVYFDITDCRAAAERRLARDLPPDPDPDTPQG